MNLFRRRPSTHEPNDAGPVSPASRLMEAETERLGLQILADVVNTARIVGELREELAKDVLIELRGGRR
jgi:hypothetical protein